MALPIQLGCSAASSSADAAADVRPDRSSAGLEASTPDGRLAFFDRGVLPDACAGRRLPTQLVEAELHFALDRSGSMTQGTKAELLLAALEAFVVAPASARYYAAMVLHPTAASITCDAAQYAQPVVPASGVPARIGEGAGVQIVAALAAAVLTGGSPWSATIQGGLDYATAEQARDPGRRVAFVFVADEKPSACEQNIPVIAALVASYDVPTYCVGLATDDVFGATTANALLCPGADFVPQPLDKAGILAALEAVRDRVGCWMPLPEEDGKVIDPTTFDLALEAPSQAPVVAAPVEDAAACAGVEYWVAGDQIGLCAAACRIAEQPGATTAFVSRCP